MQTTRIDARDLVASLVEELETVGMIAERLRMSVDTVHSWIRRYPSELGAGAAFPSPIGEIAGMRVYWSVEVDEWIVSTGRNVYRVAP